VRRLEWAAFNCASAAVVFQLFIPPVLALANNGDFGKITGRFGLYAPYENENKFAATKYTIAAKYRWDSGFRSSESLIAMAALALNKAVSKPGSFDIRCVGAIHAALYLFAFYLLASLAGGMPGWRGAVVLAVGVAVVADAMYVTALNSFYMDTAALVFLLLSTGFYLRALRWRRMRDRIGLLVCLPLLMASKMSHIAMALIFLALILWTRRELGASRAWLATFALAGAAALVMVRLGTPWDYAPIPCFNVIFYQILPQSKNVHTDLVELGLDDSYAAYIGTHSYTSGRMDDPKFERVFSERTGFKRLALFYVRHPSVPWRLLLSGLSEAGRQRADLGNYDKSTGAKEFAESDTFALWSGAKRQVFAWRGGVYLAYTVGVLAALCIAAYRGRGSVPGITIAACAFAAMVAVELLTSSLADVLDIVRHHFLFTAMLDMALVFLLAAVLVEHGDSSDRSRARLR
jgi:hypothetical protein